MSFAENERGNNFSAREIDLLKDLIQKYGSVILSKRTDALGSRDKEKAWTTLTSEFNASTNVLRTMKQLKYKWEYIKRVARKEAGKQKQSQKKTGGGPPIPPMSDTSEWISSIMKESIVGISSIYDGDSSSNTNNEILNAEKLLIVQELMGSEVNPVMDITCQQLSEGSMIDVDQTDTISQDDFVAETPSRNIHKKNINSKKNTPLKQARLSVCTNLIQLKADKIKMEIEVLKLKRENEDNKNAAEKEILEFEKHKRKLEINKHDAEMENLELEKKKKKLEILLLEKQLNN